MYRMTTAMNTSTWYNAIMTWNASGKTLSFYVNNTLQTTTSSDYIGRDTSALVIGSTGTNRFSNSIIDQTFLTNNILTQQQVTEIYNNGAGIKYNKLYYFSESGSDLNTGLSPSSPYKTIEKANTLTNYNGLLFKSDERFEGQLNINTSGAIDQNIIISKYDNGESPILSASNIVSGWTLHSGNIYKTSLTGYTTQVFINDIKANSARFPKTGYNNITSVTSNSLFSSTDINSGISYTNAIAIIRCNAWIILTKDIIGSTGQTISLSSTTSEDLNVGDGFILTNKLDFLTEPGEWYHDNITNTLYLWTFSGDTPSNYTIRVNKNVNGINIGSNDNITIDNLNIMQNNISIKSDGGNSNIIIKNCYFKNSDSKGIDILYEGENWLIKNNTFENINHYGIFGYLKNSTISYNNIENIALLDNLDITGMGKGITLETVSGKAIHIEGESNSFYKNNINNVAYSGLAFYGSNNNVEYNYIQNVCLYKEDGGAIYTYGGNESNPINTGSTITYNFIEGSYGSQLGLSNHTLEGHGIYLDNYSGDITINNNVVKNISSWGIFIHQGKLNNINNNVIINCKSTIGQSLDTGINEIKNNTMIASNLLGNQRLITERLCTYTHIYSGNTYYSPYSNDNLFLKNPNFLMYHSYPNFLMYHLYPNFLMYH